MGKPQRATVERAAAKVGHILNLSLKDYKKFAHRTNRRKFRELLKCGKYEEAQSPIPTKIVNDFDIW